MLISSPKEERITLDDYTFDDDYEYVQEKPAEEAQEDESCMHCGLDDTIDDVNDIFFCENCNRGVHQLCETPPIQAFEKNVDPWYCRNCSLTMGISIPEAPPVTAETLLAILQASLQSSSIPIKRKREDNNVDDNDKIKEL